MGHKRVQVNRSLIKAQQSWFEPEALHPGVLEAGTLPWCLLTYRDALFPSSLFVGWSLEGPRGRRVWAAPLLMTLMLLRFSSEGMGRRAACAEASVNIRWRAAMGLLVGGKTPDERTVRSFENFLWESDSEDGPRRIENVMNHIARQTLGGAAPNPLIGVMDSMPMRCLAAAKDTVNLLGDGLRRVVVLWSRAVGCSASEVGSRWDVNWIVEGKSVKGGLNVGDWKEPEQKDAAVTRLANGVLRAVANTSDSGMALRLSARQRRELAKLRRILPRIMEENLEQISEGTWGIKANHVAGGRLISLVDADARHGRKSKSKTFNGYKIHMLSDITSGTILTVQVTPANVHDGVVADDLVKGARVVDPELSDVMADAAYTGTELRKRLQEQHQIHLIGPPMTVALPVDRLSKRDFGWDGQRQHAICPEGIEAATMDTVKRGTNQVPRARWNPSDCATCPAAEFCPGALNGNGGVLFHPLETNLRAAIEEWNDPAVRAMYRRRSEGERANALVAAHGGRKARAFGIKGATLQALTIASVVNLVIYAANEAAQSTRLAA